jgi:homogentisate 1,2-dioxygenase
MPIYHSLGKIPNKRHTQFYKPDGTLYQEELFGTIGFEGMSSLLYHEHAPTQIKKINKSIDVTPKVAIEKNITSLKLIGFDILPKNDFLDSRQTLLLNKSVQR